MAGVPFEVIERLATLETSSAARKLLDMQDKSTSDGARDLATSLQFSIERSRKLLLDSARRILPAYLIFATEGMRARISPLTESSEAASGLIPRKSSVRKQEQHLLLYLQRITAKNDTFGEFGPTGWGRIDNATRRISLAPQPGIVAREAFLERWTARAIAGAISTDGETFAELTPRLNPNGRIDKDTFVLLETGQRVQLNQAQLDLIARCDGCTPVHSLNAPAEMVRDLVEQEILRCQLEVPALEPHAFAILFDEIKGWRPSPARTKWMSILSRIVDAPPIFAATAGTPERQAIVDKVTSEFGSLGVVRKSTDRILYSAINPIAENCFRDCGFSIAENLINEVAVEAAPWIDLWRDSYAFIASRVAGGLRNVLEKMSIQNGAAPLPAFLHACETAKLPLIGPGLVALAHLGFQEVKTAFREIMKSHADQAEYDLTADDCHLIRRNFEYPKFDEYTYPSADLQIAAKSVEGIARGEYQWILAELHPPVALLHHFAYWNCPDREALNRAFVSTVFDRPNFHFGFLAADFTAHTTVHLFDALPRFSHFVAPQRGSPEWKSVPPSETEVFIDEKNGDVGLRRIGTGEYLGSFARNWIIPLGFHPFQFGMTPHMPRLRCGNVIVQRRAWTVTADELGAGNFTGVSCDLVLAVERLRAQRDLPRHIYIRPTEQALRRSGAEGRDKDTKPVFVDLESYLFLEIFHRWLTKAGEIEVTEMLPGPEDLLWREPDGRRTFELRTLIVPRS